MLTNLRQTNSQYQREPLKGFALSRVLSFQKLQLSLWLLFFEQNQKTRTLWKFISWTLSVLSFSEIGDKKILHFHNTHFHFTSLTFTSLTFNSLHLTHFHNQRVGGRRWGWRLQCTQKSGLCLIEERKRLRDNRLLPHSFRIRYRRWRVREARGAKHSAAWRRVREARGAKHSAAWRPPPPPPAPAPI